MLVVSHNNNLTKRRGAYFIRFINMYFLIIYNDKKLVYALKEKKYENK